MRRYWRTLTTMVVAGLLLTLAPGASAQARRAAAPVARAAAPAPAPQPAPQAAPQVQQRIIIVDPVRVYDPFFDYPYPYTYAPDYMASNFGYVKLETDVKHASVYVDGGFADKIEKAKKFALRPGTHNIELRDSDGREIFHEKVAVIVGRTTKLHVG